jgi:hypothetical protein
MSSLERQRFALHAANLATSVHAEIDLGLRSTQTLGPEDFVKPFEGWSWQLMPAAADTSATGEASDLTTIEVVIRNTNTPSAYRLAQAHRVVKTTNAASSTAVEGAP